MAYKGLQENYGHVRNLIKMAKSDNTVNVAELTYIIWVSQKLGLSQGELEQLINEEHTQYSAPFEMEERLKQFNELINLIYVDGKIADEEVQYLAEIANQMGLNSDGTKKLLQALQEGGQMFDSGTINGFFD
jgi:uncharacterized tellurite resistance protein B-like protein